MNQRRSRVDGAIAVMWLLVLLAIGVGIWLGTLVFAAWTAAPAV